MYDHLSLTAYPEYTIEPHFSATRIIQDIVSLLDDIYFSIDISNTVDERSELRIGNSFRLRTSSRHDFTKYTNHLRPIHPKPVFLLR